MPITAAVSATTDAVTPAGERRVVCLDGVRGLMTIMVLISHYFGEIPHGITALMFGWIAVDMFFVLSGYLVGKLILEKQHNDNFFKVFYVRRVCRTLPIYFVCLAVNIVLMAAFAAPWVDADRPLPIWSYFTFTQNIFMATTGNIGAHWISPTWTLAIEEHFYLIVPLLFVVIPRRRIALTLAGIAMGALVIRAAAFELMDNQGLIGLVLLPTRADILTAGLLAAVVIKSDRVPWARFDYPLRLAPIVLLIMASVMRIVDKDTGHSFDIFGPLLVSVGCAVFLLTLVRGAPEAKRFHSRFLGFFNDTSYAVYLTHLPVLGLMHGLILGTRPDLVSGAQWIVTFAALPVCVLVAWILTVLVEKPITNYGRSWAWSNRPRVSRASATAMAVSPAE
ncbi:MAG TPA: acyltransferase [Pseudolabrys sp.]|nr:acyltransferase [Pseudolabrys sp.]